MWVAQVLRGWPHDRFQRNNETLKVADTLPRYGLSNNPTSHTASQLTNPRIVTSLEAIYSRSRNTSPRQRCPSVDVVRVSRSRLHPSVRRASQVINDHYRRHRRPRRCFMARPIQSRSNPHPSGCVCGPSVCRRRPAGVKLRYMAAIERRTCAV